MPTWEQPADPVEADLARIAGEVLAHGRTLATGGHPRSIACFVRESGELVAGGTGRTEFNRLFISYLWVSEQLRTRGLGTEILRRLETQATHSGCTTAVVETLSDAAARLYQRVGYNSVLTIPNYVGGFTRYIMIKSLAIQLAPGEA